MPLRRRQIFRFIFGERRKSGYGIRADFTRRRSVRGRTLIPTLLAGPQRGSPEMNWGRYQFLSNRASTREADPTLRPSRRRTTRAIGARRPLRRPSGSFTATERTTQPPVERLPTRTVASIRSEVRKVPARAAGRLADSRDREVPSSIEDRMTSARSAREDAAAAIIATRRPACSRMSTRSPQDRAKYSNNCWWTSTLSKEENPTQGEVAYS